MRIAVIAPSATVKAMTMTMTGRPS
jgi:hypothetical protein